MIRMRSKRDNLKTWGGNKSVRLRGFDYSGHAPYHVVIRAIPGSCPFLDQYIATTASDALGEILNAMGAYLGSYCLMPDHLHVLLSPNQSGLTVGELVGRYKGVTTNRSWRLGWTGRFWQGRFYDHILRKSEDIAEVARYIYGNPDRRGLSVDYPYRWVDPNLR